MTILGLSTIPTLFVVAFAVFRLAYLITKESGPMFVMWRLRKAAKRQGGSVEELAQCPYCCGMWCTVAIVTYLGLPFRFLFLDNVIVVLAVAGAAMLIHQAFTKLYGK